MLMAWMLTEVAEPGHEAGFTPAEGEWPFVDHRRFLQSVRGQHCVNLQRLAERPLALAPRVGIGRRAI